MKDEIIETVSNAVSEAMQEANLVVDLKTSELASVAGGLRKIGLITVDK
jgi:hypothetical protein